MRDELDAPFLTSFFFDKPVELQRVMLARGADIVGDDIVVGDLVPLFGVVPEVAGIFDQFAVVVHQDVVDGNHPLGTIPRAGVLLQTQALHRGPHIGVL